MPLSSETLFLEPDLDHPRTSLSIILAAWDDIQRNSVEVASGTGNAASVFDFSANECIYFASINRYLLRAHDASPAEEKVSQSSAAPEHLQDPSRSETFISQPPNPHPFDDGAQAMGLWETNGAERLPYSIVDKLLQSNWRRPPFNQITSVPSRSTAPIKTSQASSETIGVIYLAPAQFSGEVNLGVALSPTHRGKGLAREAVSLLLKWAFDEARYHRVQALLMEGPGRDTALKMFTALGFAHEGTRRRQVLSSFSGEYRDVTSLAILDTEWSVRHYFHHAPNSLWDELFERHQREREALLEWDAMRSTLRRTQSLETVRIKVGDVPSPENDNDERCGDGYTKISSESPIPADWEEPCENPFDASPSTSLSSKSSSLGERRETEIDFPESTSNDPQHALDPASPPPPSETSDPSGWEIESDFSSSSTSWDKLETSSVASSA